MRSIVDNIATIRSRRAELSALRPAERHLAEELSTLEAQASRFAEMCVRYHRVNLCQAGFVYGDVLRHPADPSAGLAVRLGDRVEIVEGPDTREGEIPILEATTIMARRLGRGLAFRDWHLDGVTLGSREDALFLLRNGSPAPSPEATARTDAALRTPSDAGAAIPAPMEPTASVPDPASVRKTGKPRGSRHDTLTPDLFG